MISNQQKLVDDQSFDSIPLKKQKDNKNQFNNHIDINCDQPSQGISSPTNQTKILSIENSLLISKVKNQKRQQGMVIAKVHSEDNSGKQNNLLSVSSSPPFFNDGKKNVFSVDNYYSQYFQQQKQKFHLGEVSKEKSNQNEQEEDFYQEILIEGCLVNIFALKKLINLNSMKLKSLKIRNCLFYENDKSVLKEKINNNNITANVQREKKNDGIEKNTNQDKYLIINNNNNKMLREINFAFKIKSLQLPLIEDIKIELLTSTIKNEKLQQQEQQGKQNQKLATQTQAVQRRSSIIQNQELQKPLITAEELATKYECLLDSPFIDFQLKIQPILIEKYEKFKTQTELVNHIVYGDRQGKDSVQKYINENIITNINEHIATFNKFIKGALINNNILIIKEYSLEDPLALEMIQNMIIQNRELIKTVIFKETGTIKHTQFLKIFDALISIDNLESIAFFDAQLEQQSYSILKDIIIRQSNHLFCLCKKQKNLLITLNRSSFDITEYWYQVFGKEQANDNQDFSNVPLKTVQKHYSFYILDCNDIYEFTPYEFCIQELLFPNHNSNDILQLKQDDLLKYDIGKLIKVQDKYPHKIKQEIQKYQNNQILTYSGIVEMIIKKQLSIKKNLKNQQELEDDIRELFRHSSFYSIVEAKKLIEEVKDPVLKNNLMKECPFLEYDNPHGQFCSQQDMDNLFMIQQGLLLSNNITGYLVGDQFISNGYPIKSKRKKINYRGINKNKQILSDNSVKQIFFQKEDNFEIKEIKLLFLDHNFLVVQVLQQGEYYISKQIYSEDTMDKLDFSSIYKKKTFLSFLKEIILMCVENDIQIYIIYQGSQFDSFWQTHRSIFEEMKQASFKCLNIHHSESFSFSSINPNLKIEQLYLTEININMESFKGDCNLGYKDITIKDSEIEFFDITQFKNLKKLELQQQFDKVQGVIRNLLELEQLSNNMKLLQDSTTKDCLLINIFLQKDGNEESTNQVNLKNDFAKLVVKHQGRMRFLIGGIQENILQYFLQAMKTRFTSSLNQDLLCRFYGIRMISQQNQIYIQKDNRKVSNSYERFKEDIQLQQINDNFINTEKNPTDIVCEEVKALYTSNYQIDQHENTFTEQMQEFLKHMPKCCQMYLNSPWQAQTSVHSQPTCLYLSSILKDHTSDFCLFRTSIFQQCFQLKRVEVKFFGNLLVNEPIIYDYKEMERLQELDFSKSFICNILQIKLLDILTQLSPQLRVLGFNGMEMDEETRINNFHLYFSPLKNQNLKQLYLQNISICDILPLLEVVIQSQASFSLEILKINTNYKKINEEENNVDIIQYEAKTNQILEQNKLTLSVLGIQVFTKDNHRAIMQCENLEELIIYCFSLQIIDLITIQSLRSITVYTQDLDSPQEEIESFINACIREKSHLQRINLNIQGQESKTYYRVEESDFCNNLSSNQFQVIQTPKCFSIQSNSFNKLDYFDFTKDNSIKGLEFLQKLYIDDYHFEYKNFSFLNEIFRVNKDCLSVLSFDKCSKVKNNSFDQVDFSRLPKSIEYLSFSGLQDLTSIEFLNPLYEVINEYRNLVLDISDTGITVSKVYKYMQYLKQVIISWQIEEVYPMIQYQYRNNQAQQNIIADLAQAALNDILMNKYEKKLLFQLFLQQKVNLEGKLQNIDPFIMSPLKVISSQVDFCNTGLEVYYKQKQDPRFKMEQTLGNKYLLLFCCLLKQSHQYALGYSKVYHDPFFYIQKRLDNFYEDNEQYLSDHEHLFYDYLLLLELLHKQKLKLVYLPLTLEVSHSKTLNNKKLNTRIDEMTMIENLSKIPPSEIIIDNMSIQFIKPWYVINFISPLTFKTTIQNLELDKIYNSSIGNYLTSSLSRNNFLKKLLNHTPQKYRFDETVYLLAQHFDEYIFEKQHIYLLSLFPLYIFICIFGVIYFSLYFDITCGNGISWSSYYFYLIYGIFTLLIELMMFKKCLNYISHLVPSLEIDLKPGLIISIINSIKQFIIDSTWINQWFIGYFFTFIQSQLTRFDNFTNVAFLYSTYQCQSYTIFYISLCFISIPFLHSLYEFIHVSFNTAKKYQLPTASLDTYYSICNIIEFKAVADVLDLVSPSNIISVGGRMFNSRIVSSFIRIIGESMPLVIIQIYNLSQSTMTSSLVLSLLLSIITFLTLLINLLTITPSILDQEDFIKLNQKKSQDQVVEKYEQRLQTYERESFALNFYDHLRQLRLKYLQERQSGNISLELFNSYNANLKFFDKLFHSTKVLLQEEENQEALIKGQHGKQYNQLEEK